MTAPAGRLKGTTKATVCATAGPYGCDVAIVGELVDIVTPSTCHVIGGKKSKGTAWMEW